MLEGLTKVMRENFRACGYPIVLSRPFDKRTPSHQCGTVKMGDDPATSPLDPFCRSFDHENLFVVDGATAQLFRIDTATHTPVLVDLGADTLPNADGLLLDGKTLYVVQNFRNQIAVVELSPDYMSGTIVDFLTEPFTSNPLTKVPTTIAKFGSALYAVTAGFAAPSPDFVVRVSK